MNTKFLLLQITAIYFLAHPKLNIHTHELIQTVKVHQKSFNMVIFKRVCVCVCVSETVLNGILPTNISKQKSRRSCPGTLRRPARNAGLHVDHLSSLPNISKSSFRTQLTYDLPTEVFPESPMVRC